MTSLQMAALLAVAALNGAAIGLERQRSGHATGPRARFGGIRTFTLIGASGGMAGLLLTSGATALSMVVAAGAASLIVAGYVAAMRDDIDATTEAAALVVLATGMLAGTGRIAVASGVTAAAALLLAEKSRLHAFAARIDDADLRATFRFTVMALVVLPLLPEGPYGPLGGIRPRQLWVVVLFFSGLSFAGYLARKIVGSAQGYTVAGLLGGLISSTSVTLTYARESRVHPAIGTALAAGVLAACTVLIPRVLIASAVLAPAMVATLGAYVVAPFAIGVIGTAAGWRRTYAAPAAAELQSNPLELMAALQMAAFFQVVLFAVSAVQSRWGGAGWWRQARCSV